MLHLSFAGFRHSHIFALHEAASRHGDVRISGTWENDPPNSLLEGKNIPLTHASFEELLGDCDAVAIGDCYARRGALVIQALKAGRHVISDKPLCTSLAELEEIRKLTRAGGPRVGMMLDLRDSGNLIGLRDAVRSGLVGDVQTVSISAQHPLLLGTRPSWYFEEGMHGGTLNDIAIHATDFLPWMTGLGLKSVTAARSWNAKAVETPHFHDCAQFMIELSNGGSVIGDVSYLAPGTCGYSIPNYWRIIVHGTKGFLETSPGAPAITFADDSSKEPAHLDRAPGRPNGYLEDFLAEVSGKPGANGLTTDSCIEASRVALQLEEAAAGKR